MAQSGVRIRSAPPRTSGFSQRSSACRPGLSHRAVTPVRDTVDMPSTIRPLSVVPAPDPTPSDHDGTPGSVAGPSRSAAGASGPIAAAPGSQRADQRPGAGPVARPRRAESSRAASGGSTTALQFSEAVRTVIAVAHRHRLRPPVFRSPPALDGVDRTIRRRVGAPDVVAVRRADRPVAAVRADVVEGIVAANGLAGAGADRFRHDAWAALDPAANASAARVPPTNPPAGGPRRDRTPSRPPEPVAASPSELDEVA